MNNRYLADQQVVLELICRENGHTIATLEWSFLGGKFDGGNSPVGAVLVTFPQLQKAKKMSSRVSELKKQDKVKVGAPRYQPVRGAGLYPGVGAQTAMRCVKKDRYQRSAQPETVSIDPAAADVRDAKGCRALLGK